MKQIFVFIFSIGFIPIIYCQTIASTNSGAISNDNLIYSVGEIYVNPTNHDEAGSGVIGAVSIIEFLTLGVNEIETNGNMKIYPNPTTNSIFFETEENNIEKVFIYNTNGKLIAERKVIEKQVNLTDLQTGIYLIKPNNSNVKSFKIIKK